MSRRAATPRGSVASLSAQVQGVRETETMLIHLPSPDIFVFCLSTRAGGLGINLTAADTVIFCMSPLPPGVALRHGGLADHGG